MYDTINCDNCRRELYFCKILFEKVKKEKEILDAGFTFTDRMINGNNSEIIKDLHLKACCTMTIVNRIDYAPEIYGDLPQ